MAKRTTFGGIVTNDFGYVLLRKPKDHFGGYVWTFPKRAARPGESPQETALRSVREETGVDATVEEPIPGVYEGDTSVASYFLMSRVRERGPYEEGGTQSIRWVRFGGAAALLRESENLPGRKRDLAVFGAAMQIRGDLIENGRLRPQVAPPPPGLKGICTCSLPLPIHCPAVEISQSCVAVRCSIALDQSCEDHDSIKKNDPRLNKATKALVERLVRNPEDRKSVSRYARELYVRDDHLGSSLPKAVLFSIYKHDQFALTGFEVTPLCQAILHGEEAERWPGEGTTRGPTMSQMLEVYSMRYQDSGP